MPPTPSRPFVANAADPQQVTKAAQLSRRVDRQFAESLLAVLQTSEGRLVVWDLLGRCGINESVMHPSGSMTYYNSGRQDVGHELQALVLGLDDGQVYLQMQTEGIRRKVRTNIEAAANTARPEGGQ